MEEHLGSLIIVGGAVVLAGIAGLCWLNYKLGTNSQSVKDLATSVSEIKGKLDDILVAVSKEQPAGHGSPLVLNDYGEKIANAVDAKRFAAEVSPLLRKEVAGREPFEIEEFSKDYVRRRLPAKWNREVSRCAYSMGIDRSLVVLVLAVVLRDKLLEGK